MAYEIETVTVVRSSGKLSNIRKADYDPAVHTLYVAPGAAIAPEPMPEPAPAKKNGWGGKRVKRG